MTNLFLLAAALPSLFVDGPPTDALRQSGVTCFAVPAAQFPLWNGLCAHPVEPAALVKLPSVGVEYRMNQGSASNAPWVVNNAWRYARGVKGTALVQAAEGRAALAAAEAHVWDSDAAIAAGPKDWKSLGAMQEFIKTLPSNSLPSLANIGFQDDGSPAAGENMNLLLRRNLLFRVVLQPDPKLDLNVKPKSGDPSAYAYEVRQKLTDEKRLLRLYGSEVVMARLTGDAKHRRVALLNYSNRVVEGVRIRLAGNWPKILVHSVEGPIEATDLVIDHNSTEFSLQRVAAYVLVELGQ